MYEDFVVSYWSVFVRLLGITERRGGLPLSANLRPQPGTVITDGTIGRGRLCPKN